MQYPDSPPSAALEARDSLVPFVAPERAKASRGAAWLAGRVARAGAVGGLIASLAGGVPYYFAVRDVLPLPWLRLAPMFVAFVIVAGAIYGAGAAYGVHALTSVLRPRRAGTRALVALAGATVGAALVGPLPGSVGVAYFGSLPYPFIGTATLAIAPFLGAALISFRLAVTTSARTEEPSGRGGRAALAALAATAVFCGLGAFAVSAVNDAAMLAAFRDVAAATSGHSDSTSGLAIVGLFAGALLGLGLGGQMGVSVALSGGPRSPSVSSPA